MQRIEGEIQPADAKAFAVTLDRLFAFGRAFGISQGDVREAVRFYREALRDFPAWAIEQAIQRMAQEWENGFRLPLPKELRGFIPEEYWSMRSEIIRLNSAIRALHRGEIEQEPGEPVDPEEVERVLASIRRLPGGAA